MKLLGGVLLLKSLLLFALLTSGAGLVLVYGFYLFDMHDFRDKKAGGLVATADLLASSSNSALGFEDSELGNQVLDSMRVHPGIRSAVLYKETGQVFARCVRRHRTGGYLTQTPEMEGLEATAAIRQNDKEAEDANPSSHLLPTP